MLHGAGSDARPAAGAALPQPGGTAGDTHEEPHRRLADGDGDALHQRTAAWQSILQQVVREFATDAGLGARSAPAQPEAIGVLRDDSEAALEGAGREPATESTGGAAAEHPWRGRSGGSDVGLGDRRSDALWLHRGGLQLLRADERPT